MSDFVIQLRDWKVLPVIYSLTAKSRNVPVSGSVYCPFSFIPTSELLRATAYRYDFVFPSNASSCLHEKHFSTFIKTKCNSFSFINRMISCKIVLNKSCTFLLKCLPILNGSAAQIYPPNQNKSKLNFRPHQQCPFFAMSRFFKSCPADIDCPLNSPSPY